MSITFNNLKSKTECDCLNGANEDNQSTFCFVISKDSIRDKDFTSHWEKGKKPKKDSCESKCSYMSKSLSIVNTDLARETVLNTYKQLFKVAPKYKNHVADIQLRGQAGKVKHTPSNNNPYHVDFYKSDNFSLHCNIDVINIIPLSDV
ncbi:hypothetical protein V6R21_20425 [Limibacter armeniacum]|uniref:hypothetical protein n=1 Tax=Limibacter armeniacum TaxID=466084 RepID=UPI002FE6634B